MLLSLVRDIFSYMQNPNTCVIKEAPKRNNRFFLYPLIDWISVLEQTVGPSIGILEQNVKQRKPPQVTTISSQFTSITSSNKLNGKKVDISTLFSLNSSVQILWQWINQLEEVKIYCHLVLWNVIYSFTR